MSPPLPTLRKLAGAVALEGEAVIRLAAPRAVFMKQGIAALVLSPPLGLGLGLIVGLQIPDARVGAAVGLVIGGATVAGLGLLGVVRLARAGARRAASGSVIDLQAGTLTAAGRGPQALSSLSGLRVGKPSAWLNPVAIFAASAEGEVLVLSGVPPGAQGELSEIAVYLGERLSLPVELPSWARRGDVFGMTDRQAAAMCWIPFQGIFLVASAWFLWRGQERPFVRHAARMSLLHFGVSIGVLFVAGAVGAAGWGLLALLGAPNPAAAAPLMLALLAVWFWTFGSRIYGVVQVVTGTPWVPLWVRPFAGAAPPPPADRSG